MEHSAWGTLAAVALGLVFLVSGVAKLASPARWRAESEALGVPWRLAAPLPYVEVVLAAWLIVQWHRQAAAWCAVALLSAFTALLALRLAQGRRPPCACFGSLSSKPIGPGHLVRNAALIVLGVAAAVL